MIVVNILPVLQPLGIIFGLVAVYLALSHGVDIFMAVFRGIVVYAVFILLGLIFNYFYLMVVNRAKISEAERAAEEARRKAEEARTNSSEEEVS